MHKVGDEENPVRQRGVEVFGTELHDLRGARAERPRRCRGLRLSLGV